MPFCDPTGSGIDICPPVGGDTTAEHGECRIGFDDLADFGQRELGGCGMGCWACKDYPDEIIAHVQHEGGTRWLRPAPAGSNRDAAGMLHDLRSGEAHPIGPRMIYERSPCYRQDGEECFGRFPCRCWRGGLDVMEPSVPGGPCSGGEQAGEAITSEHFPDAFGYRGWDWPMHADQIECRRFQDLQASRVPASPLLIAGMPAPVFLRYSQFGVSCAPNGFIPCLAHPQNNPGNDCLGFWKNHPTPFDYPGWPDHWLNDRSRFDELRLTENTARFEPSRLSSPMDHVGIELKNRALVHVRDTTFRDGSPNGVSFDRVDLDRSIYDGASQWHRSFNRDQDCAMLALPETLLGTFPDCRLALAGDRITMNWHVLSVAVTVLLVTQKYFLGQQQGSFVLDEIEYHARAQIDIRTAWIGPPTLDHHEDCSRLPTAPGDRIVYLDNGRPFRPPQRIIWLGYLGRLGADPTNRQSIWLGDTIEGHCDAVADGVSVNPVDGWPVLGVNTPGRPSGHYGGRLRLEFAA